MRWDTIVKARSAVFRANMADYERGRAEFSRSQARAELAGLPGGGLDIAHEAVDRHAARDRAAAVALRCVGCAGEVTECCCNDLRWKTNRFGAQIPPGIGARHG